jgi:hypothetical protein
MSKLPTILLALILAGCTPTAVSTAATPAASAAPAAAATPSAPSSPAGAAPARQLEAGAPANGNDAALGKTARTDAEWKALYASVNPDKAPPTVDFTKEMVVAVFAGAKSDAGYEVAVTDVGYGADKVAVSYAVTHKDGFFAQVISYPYVFVAINRSDLAVNFNDASAKK